MAASVEQPKPSSDSNRVEKEAILASDAGTDSTKVEEASPEPGASEAKAPGSHLLGWRRYMALTGICVGLFLALMEIAVVSTALVNITNELQAFKNSAWIVNAYLVAFTSFLVIWVQFSHVFGRKPFILAAYVVFIAFSGACAGSKTVIELIVFRALQGIGGSGVFNLSMVMVSEVVKPEEFPKWTAIVSAVFTLSYGIGPLIGGAITSNTSWRWVFWINLPAAAIPFILLSLALPRHFPHHVNPGKQGGIAASVKKLDTPGALLFLGSSVLLITALQGSDVAWSWGSATSICLLIFAGISTLLFTAWERRATIKKSHIPIISWDFTTRRALGMFLTFCLVNMPTTATVVQLPERFQVVNGLSPFDSGARLIPFIAMVPFASIVSSIVVSKFKIQHGYALLVGIAIQIIAASLFATQLPSDANHGFPKVIYAFQIILGIGLGINSTIVVTSVPHMVAKPLIPSALGAGMQFRYLGGALGLGLVVSVFNAKLRSQLGETLPQEDVTAILQSTMNIAKLSIDTQQEVRQAFVDNFNLQWKVLLGPIVAQIPAALMML